MSSTLPELSEEDLARLREAISRAANPHIPRLQKAMARIQADQQAQLRLAAAPMTRMQEQIQRLMREVMAPAEEARREMVRQAMAQWSHGWRRAWEAHLQQNLAAARLAAQAAVLDTSPLSRVLRDMEAWRRLTEQQRAEAVAAVEEAYEGTSADEVPAGMVQELEDAVRDYAASEAVYLPIEVRRESFALFIATIVLSTLMTLAFTSDTADGVLTKAVELSVLAGVSMVAAGKAWDRYSGIEQADGDEGS